MTGLARHGGIAASEVTLTRASLNDAFYLRVRNNRNGDTIVVHCQEDTCLNTGDIIVGMNGIDVTRWGRDAVCHGRD